MWIHSEKEGRTISESDWMLLAENSDLFSVSEIQQASTPRDGDDDPIRLWTDDYSNLFQVLK